jgi:endonuclease/exonuclease/phosphatase family metal-dependent hydrolase
MQEFYSNANWPVNIEKKIAETLHTKYYTFNNIHSGNKNVKIGTIIYSKYPIKNSGTVPYATPSGNSTMYIDVEINGIAVRVFNVHLQSIRFKPKDYEFLKEIGQGNAKTVEESKSIIARMKQAYILRAEQAKLVQEAIKKSPGKVLVCGDFNDSPVSFAYQKVSDGLKDAFIESGSGLGRTYSNIFPGVRIDYIFGSQSFDLNSCEVVHKKYSDHFPVKSIVDIK